MSPRIREVPKRKRRAVGHTSHQQHSLMEMNHTPFMITSLRTVEYCQLSKASMWKLLKEIFMSTGARLSTMAVLAYSRQIICIFPTRCQKERTLQLNLPTNKPCKQPKNQYALLIVLFICQGSIDDPRVHLFEEEDSDKNILYKEADGNATPQIRGGTVEKLIQKLTYHQFPGNSVSSIFWVRVDPEFVQAFLLTYTAFLSPKELLYLLVLRYPLDSAS